MLMGAHAAPVVRPPPTPNHPTRRQVVRLNHSHIHFLLIIILVLVSAIPKVLSEQLTEGENERDTLLKFKSSLENAEVALASWNAVDSSPPCPSRSWAGVICNKGNVWGLQLEHMNLSGEIDVDSLLPLSQLRTLSFMHNQFDGPLPEFRKLGALKALFLSDNKFYGDIADDAFKGMTSLKKVYMADNMFTGNIPTSLAYSPRLFELRLENNQFVGPIPDFPPDVLKQINVSNNQLQGIIPPSLRLMDLSSFSGNKDLCGPPLKSICISSTNTNSTASSESAGDMPPSEMNSTMTLTILIYVACVVIALSLIALVFLVYQRGKTRDDQLDGTTTAGYSKGNGNNKDKFSGTAAAAATVINKAAAPESTGGSRSKNKSNPSASAGDQHGKLSFVREERLRFDLQDLLRASAEVLGSGSFGSSYKAVLMDGQAVVVKRFKQMNNCGKEEFHEHMRRLGRLGHPNLLPLVAYYYRKEEKLLVFDFVHNGSLARQLHGNHSAEKPGLDWPTRLKIIKGVSKGLAYLYHELPSLTVAHGHLKSSNVLLDKAMDPQLMDYTLVPVVNVDQAQHFMVAYKAPEYAETGKLTKKTDVWSLGILILETLTGKFPANYLAQGPGGADLSSWVSSIIGEKDDENVFDKEMGKTDKARGEMHKLLKIGTDCCIVDVDKRIDLKEAVERIELLKDKDN